MSSIIQQARDILKRWRDSPMAESLTKGRTLVPLVDGTAGNPDLLDAIDGLLSFAQAAVVGPNGGHFGSMVGQAHIIAAAIVAADERMNA